MAFVLLIAGCMQVQESAAEEMRLIGVARSAHEIVVIEPRTGAIAARHATGLGPHEIALSPDGRTAYVPNFGSYPEPHVDPREGAPVWVRNPSGTMTKVDLVTGATDLWRLTECMRPHGIEAAPDGSVVWVTCEDGGTVQELDAQTGSRRRSWNTGQRGSHELALSGDGRRLIVANTIGASVTIIDLEDGVLKSLPTGRATEGMAFSPGGRQLYALSAGDSRLSVVDIEALETVTSVELETAFPISLVVPAGRNEIWIAGNQANEILILDAETLRTKDRIGLGTQPLGMAASEDGSQVFVSLPRRNQIAGIGTASRREFRRFDGIMEGDGIALWRPATANVSSVDDVMQMIEHRAAAADGTTVHVYEYPPAVEDGGHAPLLMFHQAGGDARGELGPLARRLAAAGRHVFTADLRSGGDRFGSINQTMQDFSGGEAGYCDAYADMEAALDLVFRETAEPAIAIGSSYSAALAVKLAALNPEKIAGIVAFSPAGGDPMAGCKAEDFVASLRAPGLSLRGAGAAARVPWIPESNRKWRDAGVDVKEVDAQGHGASLLIADRTEGDTLPIWRELFDFLKQVDRRAGEGDSGMR